MYIELVTPLIIINTKFIWPILGQTPLIDTH